ncbi:MAG: transglutaminase domain-containing protein [Burkholderiales bacterium]|nr:transglutaminase domain-containing protein [Burkholderiales bacterium]
MAATATLLYAVFFGSNGIWVFLGLFALLAGNLGLATRRHLLLDLILLSAIFCSTVVAGELPGRSALGSVFLACLAFALLAEHADRRLGARAITGGPDVPTSPLSPLRATWAIGLLAAVAMIIYLPVAGFEKRDPDALPERGPPTQAISSAAHDPNLLTKPAARGNEAADAGRPGSERPLLDAKHGFPERLVLDTASDKARHHSSPQDRAGTEVAAPSGAASGERSGCAVQPRRPSTSTEIVLLFMRAQAPLNLRARAYVLPTECGWIDGWDAMPAIVGLKLDSGALVWHGPPDDRTGVHQRMRIMQAMDHRLPSALAPVRAIVPAGRVGYSADRILIHPGPVGAGLEYEIVSRNRSIEGRISSLPERSPDAMYLRVPRTLTPRVEAFARELAGARTDHREIAAALETHLRESYARGVPTYGDGKDAIEAFLFDQRRGGSAEFAVTLAVMLRTVGIPARVIAGYRARRFNPMHNAYEVWITDGHFWVEAYVAGVWVTHEPSPWVPKVSAFTPPTAFDAAREYVRLAREVSDPMFEPDGRSIPQVDEDYLDKVLLFGWIVTLGPALLMILALGGVVRWCWPRWVRLMARLRSPATR